jgi:hypothetical protein
LPKTIAKRAGGLQYQRNNSGSFHYSQLGILERLLIFPFLSGTKRPGGEIRAKSRRHGGMGNREVKEEGGTVQGQSQIRSFTIFSASFRDRLQTSFAEE